MEAARVVAGREPGGQDDEAPEAFALDLVRDADGGGLGDGGVSDGRTLDLGGASRLPEILIVSVAAAVQEPEAVVIDRGQSRGSRTSGQRDQ